LLGPLLCQPLLGMVGFFRSDAAGYFAVKIDARRTLLGCA
jgi:hypothetical protein